MGQTFIEYLTSLRMDKAIVVVIIVTLQSDVFKKYIANLKAKRSVAAEGGQK